jgi:hypothetical protein
MATETVFQRKLDHTGVPGIEFPRVISAALHLAIPLVTYQVMYEGLGTEGLSRLTTVVPLSPERKGALYFFLNIFYSVCSLGIWSRSSP